MDTATRFFFEDSTESVRDAVARLSARDLNRLQHRDLERLSDADVTQLLRQLAKLGARCSSTATGRSWGNRGR